MWFSGLDFLKMSNDLCPRSMEGKDHAAVAAKQKKMTHAVEVAAQNEFLEIESFSSCRKLRNVAVYVRRPYGRWKQRRCGGEYEAQETISVQELQKVEQWLIKEEQKKFYQRELCLIFQTRNRYQKVEYLRSESIH